MSVLTARPNRQRLTERDADYLRLRNATARRLTRSVARLVRDLRHPGPGGQTVALHDFIQRQTAIMQDAYTAAVREGARDYFQETSAQPAKWAKGVQVDPERMAAALRFYAPSIAKMAHEALSAYNAAPGVKLEELIAAAEETVRLFSFGGFGHFGARPTGGIGGEHFEIRLPNGEFNGRRPGGGQHEHESQRGIHEHLAAHRSEEGGGGASRSSRSRAAAREKSPNEGVTPLKVLRARGEAARREPGANEPFRGPGHASQAEQTRLLRKWNTQHETYKAYVNRPDTHEAELQKTAFHLELLVRRGWGPGSTQYDRAEAHFNETKKAMMAERRAEAKAKSQGAAKKVATKAAPKAPAKSKVPRETTAYHTARRQYQAAAKRLTSARTQVWNTQRTLYRLEARKNLKPADHERITQLRAKVQDRENQAYQHQLAHGEARTRLFEARRTYLDKQLGYKLAGGEQDVRRLYTLFGGPRAAHQAIHDIVRPGKGESVHIGWNGDTKHGISVVFQGKTHDIKFEVAQLSAKRRAAMGGRLFVHDPSVQTHGKNVNGGREIIQALNAMRQHGVSFIRTGGARDATHNGYDTWAKLGAEGFIPKSVRAAARERFGPGVRRVEQIMDQPGGPRWWREHGDSWNLRMHLFPGGRTAANLDQLMARANRAESLNEPVDFAIFLAEIWGDDTTWL